MAVIYHCHQLIVYPSMRGDELWLVARIPSAGKIRNPSARFFHDHDAGRTVPGLQLMLIEPIKPACSYPAKVHGCRAKPPDRYATADQSGEHFQRSIGLIQVGIGETCYQAGF